MGLRSTEDGRPSRAVFRSCLFSGNKAGNHPGGGLYATGIGVDVLCENCTFLSNSTGTGGGGAYVGFGADATIANCTFYGNWSGSEDQGALEFDSATTDGLVENTIVAATTHGCGIWCGEADPDVELRCCDIFGNAGGDWVGTSVSDQWGIHGNFWGDPGFCDPENRDFSIHSSSPCAPDELMGCGLVGAQGIGGCADSEHLYVVEADGGGDFPHIQAAVDGCSNWDVIELRGYVFTGVGNRDITFPQGRAVTVRSESGDPAACVIDCEGYDPSFHRAFSFSNGNGQEIMVRGIGVTGGDVDPEAQPPADKGGAINCAGGSPRIARCLLFRNVAQDGGGAVFCGHEPGATLTRCTLSGNSSSQGAGLYCDGGARAVLQTSIVSFSPSGEAIACDGAASAVLSCCDVYGNAGGDWIGCIESQGSERGNWTIEPCFCDEENDDYRLHSNSWCVNNGSCEFVGAMLVGCGEGDCWDPSAAPQHTSAVSRNLLLRTKPNPLAGPGVITYSLVRLPEGARVVLSVHDSAGRFVRSLVDGPQPPGEHSVTWNGADQLGHVVEAGVYFYRLSAAGQTIAMPALVVR